MGANRRMGDLIRFPVEKVVKPLDENRLKRVQESLRKINELLRKLKNERD